MHHPFMSPMSQNITDISDDMREKALKRTAAMLQALDKKALKRTAAMLQALDKIRRTLEMPVEQLPIVIDIYGKIVTALIAEVEREDLVKRTSREPLTMQSTNANYEPMKIPPGRISNVTARPKALAFRPEDFAIHGDRSRWMVHDIMVGNRSQFVGKRGPALGTEFGPGGICEHLRLETCQTAMDLVMVIEYVGPEADGEVFEATIVGTGVAAF